MVGTQIVLTGANGLVGFEVLKLLRSRYPQVPVKALVRKAPVETLPGVQYVSGELPDTLPADLFTSSKIVLIHCASLLKAEALEEYWKVNVHGTKNLLELGGGKITKVIYLSSMSAYGQGPFDGINEETPSRPETQLARTRFEAEEVIRSFSVKHKVPCLLLRPRFLFGIRDKETLPALIKLHQKKQMIASGEQRFSFIGVDDLALVVVRLLEQDLAPKTEILNVAYAEAISLKEIFELLGPVTGFRTIPAKLFIILGAVIPPLRSLRVKLQLIGQDQVMDVSKLSGLAPEVTGIDAKKKFEALVKSYKEVT